MWKWLWWRTTGLAASAAQTRCAGSARGRRKGPDLPVAEQHSQAPLHLGWKTLGHARRFDTEIVNSVDDFVICGQVPAAVLRAVVKPMMEQLRLPLNARKTR